MGGESVTESESSAAGGSAAVALSAAFKPMRAGGKRRANLHWWAGRRFIQEVWRRGEPNFGPEFGYVLLQRMPGMDALEAQYRGRVLLATAVGDRTGELMAAALLDILEKKCWVRPSQVRIEVATPPHNLWLTFNDGATYTRVLESSMQVRCAGSWIQFVRWNRSLRATAGGLEYKTTVSFEGLPDEAWEPEAVNAVLNKLGGELIEILPPEDKRELVVDAWFRNPKKVPKVLEVKVPEPKVPMWSKLPSSDDECESPPAPVSPTSRRTLLKTIIVHVTSVIDHGELLSEDLPDEYLPNEGACLSHQHEFVCWRGRVDGTGPGGDAGCAGQ